MDWNPLINLKHSCTQVCSTFLEYKDLVESSSIGWVSWNAAKNADRNFEARQASMARWPETVVEKILVLPADFGVNLSLLAAHTAKSR